jgi:guanylate kinase
MHRGDLFILSAPSGAGKTTLIQNLLMTGDLAGSGGAGGLAFSVSYTTRPPRDGEVEGKDYHFIGHDTFLAMIAAGRFLEWAEVHGHYYGTAYDEVFPRLEQGIDVVLDIDVQGAERVLSRYPEAHSIFVLPPSFEDLERRLHQRALDDEGQIARRLEVALQEIQRFDRYRYVIINDDACRASGVLAAIILEKRHRRERMLPRVQHILRDFQDRASAPQI